jgi:hypothetical protein
MRQNAGEGCEVSANEYSCAHRAQINSRDVTPYLTYDLLLPEDGWIPSEGVPASPSLVCCWKLARTGLD